MNTASKKEKSLTLVFIADEKTFQVKAFEMQGPE